MSSRGARSPRPTNAPIARHARASGSAASSPAWQSCWSWRWRPARWPSCSATGPTTRRPPPTPSATRRAIDRLVAESDRELDSHLDLALLLAVEARRRDDTTATRGALLTALTHNITSERLRPGASPSTGGQIHATNSSFLGFLAGPPRLQFDVDVSDDGRTVASAGPDETGDGGLVLDLRHGDP